jgi:hypothetical protein
MDPEGWFPCLQANTALVPKSLLLAPHTATPGFSSSKIKPFGYKDHQIILPNCATQHSIQKKKIQLYIIIPAALYPSSRLSL